MASGLISNITKLIILNCILILNLGRSTYAQIPTTQDCKGAIAVCDYIYVEDSTAAGYGNYLEIPNGGNNCPNHCMDGEHNSRWYIWTVVESGDLRFEITPQVQTDDYDWSVFDITEHSCDDVWNNVGSILSSCNAAGGAGYQGSTGVSSLNGGTNNCNNGGPTNKWNADIPVVEGETYVLVVSDWTQTPGGYTLDFSASTAVIFDDQKPSIDYIGGDLITACATNELLIEFNENVKCSSIQPYDFKLEGPGGPYTIDSIYGETCDLGGNNEREYILYFTPAIYQGGDYTLEIKQFSFISDACNNYAENETYDFEIDLDSPDVDAGEDIDIPYAGTATLSGSASSGSGSYFYSWRPDTLLVNPNIQNPTTVSLTSSTEFILSVSDQQSACVGEDTVWVNVVGGPLGVTITASSTEICYGESVNLQVNPDGGSGTYTYEWSSNPTGFTSTAQNPTVYPEINTWYKVFVTDGYTDIYDSVFITVNQLPVADAGNDQVINEGTITTLEGNGSGGSGTLSYLWEPSSWLEINNISNPVTLPLFQPTVFSLWVTDSKQCTSEPDNVLINASGGGLAAFPWSDSVRICWGQSTTIHANATGGGLEYTYEWSSQPAGFTSTEANFQVSPLTTTTYNLLLTDQYLNEVEASITITVDELPQVDLIPENANVVGIDTIAVCVRDTVLLDAGFDSDPPGSEYLWLENSVSSRFITASTNGPWFDVQTHSVRVTNGSTGCINTGGITIMFDFDECAIGYPENRLQYEELINIQPNPNNGTFDIELVSDISNINILIYSSTGLLIEEIKLNKETIGKRININNLSPGIYYIYSTSTDKYSTNKVIVQ